MKGISFDNRKIIVRRIAFECSFWLLILITVLTELFQGNMFHGAYLLLVLLVIRIVYVTVSFEHIEIILNSDTIEIIKGKNSESYLYSDFVNCEWSPDRFHLSMKLVFNCNNELRVINLNRFSFNQYLQIADLVRIHANDGEDNSNEYLEDGLYKQIAESFDITHYIKMCLGLLLSLVIIVSFAIMCAYYYDMSWLIRIITIIGGVFSLSIVFIILYVVHKANTYKERMVKELLIGSNSLLINDNELKYENISCLSITPPYLRRIKLEEDNRNSYDYSINKRINLPAFKMEDRILVIKSREPIESFVYILGSRPLYNDNDNAYCRLYNSLKRMCLNYDIILDENDCISLDKYNN